MITVLDVLAVLPGRLDEVRRIVRDDYAPLVEPLGMQLTRCWIHPGVELVDRPVELLLLWDLPDVASFWRARTVAARDPRVLAFWDAVTPLLATRERKVLCDPDDITVLR